MRLLVTLAFALFLTACGENYTEPIHSNVDTDATEGNDSAATDDPTAGLATADDTVRD